MLGITQLLPDAADAIIGDVLRIGAVLGLAAGFCKWLLNRLAKLIDDRLAPVHRRIDEHMNEEEASLADYEARLAWLSGATAAIAGSLGVPLSPPPPDHAGSTTRTAPD